MNEYCLLQGYSIAGDLEILNDSYDSICFVDTDVMHLSIFAGKNNFCTFRSEKLPCPNF